MGRGEGCRDTLIKHSQTISRKPGVTGTAPRFSIILCTYNRRNLVLSTLASLRRQTLPYDQFEVIVIDNGSTDGTLNAVRTYVEAGSQQPKKSKDTWRVQCLSEPQNGLAHARNTGLLAASGDIAVFLDDDTIADPHFLERLLIAYEETGADAIGGRVELRWEAPRPHWLTDGLLDMLGYFAPNPVRMQLQECSSFSSSSFSIKVEALRSVGYFSPFLSKRLHLPARMEVHDLCRRLHKAGYTLWYEPEAIVVHRVPAARLIRPFFVGRAYWEGRAEVLTQFTDTITDTDTTKHVKGTMNWTPTTLQALFREVRQITYLALIHRPLLYLAGRSTNERLLAAMAQAAKWGRLQQRLQLLEHVPAEATTPAVLLVRPAGPDPAAELLKQALTLQDVSCTTAITDIPLSWLWQHRAHQGQSLGIVHFYRPGAFDLTHRQRQRLYFRLWLAQHWGIRIVTTDTGGWWQSVGSLRFLSRRALERKLMHHSDIVLAYTHQPEQLYPDKKLRRHICCLPHPGFRGYYTPPIVRAQAHKRLGLPTGAGFVYLCFAQMHTERELVYLIEAFSEVREVKPSQRQKKSARTQSAPQLLLVGSPTDKKMATHVLKLAALNSAIHLYGRTPRKEDIPLYMGAADAIVLPHFAMQVAGVLETAVLAISYERVVIAPRLPRFQDMLPPRTHVLYDPISRESLVRALVKAQKLTYHLSEKEAATLDAESSWGQYAQRLLKIYKQLLKGQAGFSGAASP